MSGRPGSYVLLLAGMLAGVLAFGLVRLALLPPQRVTHYHANWAIYIDGERLDLSADRYMEDVVSCMVDPLNVEPADRVHLHNNNPDVVHVHDQAATWGHLLANLGFGVGADYLVTATGEKYFATPERTLKFILNGARISNIRNVEIGSGDRLLISYGPEPASELVRTQFPRVAADAEEYNSRPDPATCAGAHEHGLSERLRRAFWF